MNHGAPISKWIEAWKGFFLILVTVVVVYPPVFASDYGFSDDFVCLIRPISGAAFAKEMKSESLSDGRYLQPLWTGGLLGHARGIQDLKYIRLISVLGIFLSAVVFYRLTRKYLLEDQIDAALAASLFAINPTFLVTSGWAMIGSINFAILLGLLSIYVLLLDDQGCATDANSPSRTGTNSFLGWNLIHLIASALLLFASLLIYQPGAMIFWTGAAIWIVGRFEVKRENWQKIGGMVTTFVIVCVAYFIVIKMFAPATSRFNVSLSIARRVGWLVLYPLQNGLSYPTLQLSYPAFSSTPLWCVIALMTLSWGLWRYCLQTSRSLWIPLFILIIMPLTVLPAVIAADHYDVARTRAALYGLIIILWCVVFKAVANIFKNAFKLQCILVPLLVVLAAMGQYELQRYYIIPQIREESVLQLKLEEYARDNPNLDRLIVILPPPKNARLAGFKGTDEMGIVSSSQIWAADLLIKQILADVTNRKFEDLKDVKILAIYHDEPVPADAFKIDLRQLGPP